jgi:hypothetical protein
VKSYIPSLDDHSLPQSTDRAQHRLCYLFHVAFLPEITLSQCCPRNRTSDCMDPLDGVVCLPRNYTHPVPVYPMAGGQDETDLVQRHSPTSTKVMSLLYSYFLVSEQVCKPGKRLGHPLHNPCLFKEGILNISYSS